MIRDNELEVGGDELRRIHRDANRRKRDCFWIGFLEGTQASGRIEEAEVPALEAEAMAFVKFFQDPDARDLVEDIRYVHDSNSSDLYDQISDVVEAKRRHLSAAGDITDADRMNEFLGFCAGIICDGKVLHREATAMLERFKRDPYLAEHAHLAKLRETLVEAMADSALTEDEAEDVRSWVARIVGDGYYYTGLASIGHAPQLENMLADHAEVAFTGMCFVITGALRMGPRREIADAIVALNGVVAKTITFKTNYVIIASNASRDWKMTHLGTKIEKAIEYQNQGAGLRFVPEHVFEAALAAQGVRLIS